MSVFYPFSGYPLEPVTQDPRPDNEAKRRARYSHRLTQDAFIVPQNIEETFTNDDGPEKSAEINEDKTVAGGEMRRTPSLWRFATVPLNQHCQWATKTNGFAV
jgi:hypothetical protein